MSWLNSEGYKRLVTLQLSLNTTQSAQVGTSSGGSAISGGYRKWLSLECEFISTRELILSDESTSELDAFQALCVMESVRKLVDAGHTVIISIHQPSSAVFETMDDNSLLCAGSVVYTGPCEEAPVHFAKFGNCVPPNCNPAEHCFYLISVCNTSVEAASKCIIRIGKLVPVFMTKQDSFPIVNNIREEQCRVLLRFVLKDHLLSLELFFFIHFDIQGAIRR